MKTYILNPTMTFNSLTVLPNADKPAVDLHPNTPEQRALRQIVEAIAPEPAASPKAMAIFKEPGHLSFRAALSAKGLKRTE